MKFQTPEEFWKETYDRWEKEKDPENPPKRMADHLTDVYKIRLERLNELLDAEIFDINKIRIPDAFSKESLEGFGMYFCFGVRCKRTKTKLYFRFNNRCADEGELTCYRIDTRNPYVTCDNFYDTCRNIMTVEVRSNDDIERFVAAIFGVNYDEVHIKISEPAERVEVHKITGYSMYSFKARDTKFIVTTEKDRTESHDYLIRIMKPDKSCEMMKVSAVRSGKYFRSVLLRHLNIWYRECFGGRARFVWGKNLIMK